MNGRFQLDETGPEDEFRVVRTDERGNVVGDFTFEDYPDGDVLLLVRRFDEAEFGELRVHLP